MESSESNFEAVEAVATPSPLSPQSDTVIGDDQLKRGDFIAFDHRNISADRMAGIIFMIFAGIGAVAGIIVPFFAVGIGWVFYSCVAAITAIFFPLLYYSIQWPVIEHRHRSWRLSDVGLEVRRGVWWKHMQAIPWARVQHADVSQGPIQRMYGVGTLTLHTAGTSNSSIDLAGLSHEVAIELRDEIVRQRATTDVV